MWLILVEVGHGMDHEQAGWLVVAVCHAEAQHSSCLLKNEASVTARNAREGKLHPSPEKEVAARHKAARKCAEWRLHHQYSGLSRIHRNTKEDGSGRTALECVGSLDTGPPENVEQWQLIAYHTPHIESTILATVNAATSRQVY